MRDLLLKLQAGVKADSLDKKELQQLHLLLKAKILSDRPFLKLPDDLFIGTLSLPKNSFGKKRPNGYLMMLGVRGRDLFIPASELNGAQGGDLVIARGMGRRRGRPAAKIIFVAESNLRAPIGYLSQSGKQMMVLDLDTTVPMPVVTKQKALKGLPEGTVITIDPQSGDIAEILGHLEDPAVDEAIVLARYNREDHFGADLVMEAKSHGMSVDKSLYPDRHDLTDLPFITIDPVSAKDFDDAIYYDSARHTLYVAIADVSAYVHEYGAIDKEAIKRGFTFYMPHKSVPMLPRELSEEMCSLKPEVDRLAFVFKLELDENNRVKDHKLYEAVIHSRVRYHYDRIDALLEGAKPEAIDEPILKWLLPLRDLIVKLRKRRLQKGFSFHNPEIDLVLGKDLHLKETIKAQETLSHKLIEECMLLANCAAASYFTFGIFRTHEPPEDRAISELLSDLARVGIHVSPQKTIHQTVEMIQAEAEAQGLREQIDRLVIRSMKRAQYTYDNVGHFGLGFERYTHFTSPIRRYADLMLHRLLKSIINHDTKRRDYLLSALQRLTPQITLLEGEVSRMEWQYADRVYARWAAAHTGEVLEGFVTDEGALGRDAIVEIDDERIQGFRVFVPRVKKRPLHLFERVRVELSEAHLATTRITAYLES